MSPPYGEGNYITFILKSVAACIEICCSVECFIFMNAKCVFFCEFIYIYNIYIYIIQGVPGGMDKTSGECSLC